LFYEFNLINDDDDDDDDFKITVCKLAFLCFFFVTFFQSHAEVIQAAKDALDKYGNGLSSVRFICGTQVNTIFFLRRFKLPLVNNSNLNFRLKYCN